MQRGESRTIGYRCGEKEARAPDWIDESGIRYAKQGQHNSNEAKTDSKSVKCK